MLMCKKSDSLAAASTSLVFADAAVWKQLELQNPTFFCNYSKELALKVSS